MTNERMEQSKFTWATYVCSNPNCNDEKSPRDDKRCFEPVAFLKTAIIPDEIPCPNCHHQMRRDLSIQPFTSLP